MPVHYFLNQFLSYLECKTNDISFLSSRFMGMRDKEKNILSKDMAIDHFNAFRRDIKDVKSEKEDSHTLVYFTLNELRYILKIRYDNEGKINSIVEELYREDDKVCVIVIEYDGSRYYGMQKQKNESMDTIQDELEKALKIMTGKEMYVCPSSRTDKGVHAMGQVVHFASQGISPESYKYALNNILPKDIRVKDAYLRSQLFNSRYDVVSKTYNYVIDMGEYSVFKKDHVLYTKVNNIARMREELKSLKGTHDFEAFCKGEKEDTIRTIFDAQLHLDGDRLILTFTADGFLHNMIRFIVGELLEIDKTGVGSLKVLIDSKDKNKTPHLAPASGLYLVGIQY